MGFHANNIPNFDICTCIMLPTIIDSRLPFKMKLHDEVPATFKYCFIYDGNTKQIICLVNSWKQLVFILITACLVQSFSASWTCHTLKLLELAFSNYLQRITYYTTNKRSSLFSLHPLRIAQMVKHNPHVSSRSPKVVLLESLRWLLLKSSSSSPCRAVKWTAFFGATNNRPINAIHAMMVK